MRLVFVHGWGFDAPFWDGLAAELDGFAQCRIELGFLGAIPSSQEIQPDDILVGHSLGFLCGLSQSRVWAGAIAINGFARFTGGESEAVPPQQLRAMRASLRRDPHKTLTGFYRNFGLEEAPQAFDAARLAEGLAFLESAALPQVLPRVMVLASHHDPLVPEAASQYLATASHASLHWHDRGGHLLPLTAPSWCAAHIRAFAA